MSAIKTHPGFPDWRGGREKNTRENRGYHFTCTLLTYTNKTNLETIEQAFVPNTTPIGIKSRYTMYNKEPLVDKLYR